MARRFFVVVLAALLSATLFGRAPEAAAESRVKDVARVLGIRDNSLIGYGLVIGLNGTGDKASSNQFTPQTIANMLQRMGIAIPFERLDPKNVAAVMVTAKLPPFAKPGSTVDVTVSSLGDALTLQGGTLLLTPLQGPDGRVYAVAQGALSVGGASASGASGDTVQKNHPTVGRVPNGALVEREVPNVLDPTSVTLMLQRPDATTAARLAAVVNETGEGTIARAVDPSTVTVAVPAPHQPRLIEFIARIEGLTLSVDAPARVVINERTGTIIMGSQLTISTVAIAHGNLTIQVRETPEVSQPNPFAPRGASTVVVPRSNVAIKEEKASLSLVGGVSIGDIVQGLNSLGVTPRDLISILQAIRQAGALMADIEIM